jgi:hypothetical protein
MSSWYVTICCSRSPSLLPHAKDASAPLHTTHFSPSFPIASRNNAVPVLLSQFSRICAPVFPSSVWMPHTLVTFCLPYPPPTRLANSVFGCPRICAWCGTWSLFLCVCCILPRVAKSHNI